MEFRDIPKDSEVQATGSFDAGSLERRIQTADAARPGDEWLGYSQTLGGDLRAQVSESGGTTDIRAYDVHDGQPLGEVGRAAVTVEGNQAALEHFQIQRGGYWEESVLLRRAGQAAHDGGANRLIRWIEDGDTNSESRFRRLGFQPGTRVGAGVDWYKPV